jgi:hypothetical protein
MDGQRDNFLVQRGDYLTARVRARQTSGVDFTRSLTARAGVLMAMPMPKEPISRTGRPRIVSYAMELWLTQTNITRLEIVSAQHPDLTVPQRRSMDRLLADQQTKQERLECDATRA